MTDLTPDNETRSGAQGPGRLIRQAREQARLSIEDLSGQIKLARGTLDALERDDFAVLSMPVYVRGYYRKLAKLLPLSETELLSAYEAVVAPKAPPPPSKLILAGGQDLGGASRYNLPLVAGVLILAMLLGLAAFWGTRDSQTPPPVLTEPLPVEQPASPAPPVAEPLPEASAEPDLAPPPDLGAAQVQPSPVDSGSAAAVEAPSPAALTLAPALSQVPPAPLVSAPVAAPVPRPVPLSQGPAELLLQFSSTSWARVEDAKGKSLLSGVIQSGDLQTLRGEAPFSIFLGNAPAVSIKLNGQSVDMLKYTKGNNTARFSLP